MDDRRRSRNSIDPEVGICQKCGVTGFIELLKFCDVCQVSAEHRYCFNEVPKFSGDVKWSCEECVPTISLKKLSLQPTGNSEQREVEQPQENPNSGDDVSKKALSNPSLENHNNCYALPVIDPVWRGCFDISNDKYGRIAAHISSKACLKVWEGAKALPPLLSLEMLSRTDVWPKRFNIAAPTGDSIALYFFLEEKESVQNLLERSRLQLNIGMIDAEPVASHDEESATSTFEQLGKAFTELEASTGASEIKVLWKEIEEYFDNLERLLNKGFIDLEIKEKAFVEKKSEICALVAEREAVVAGKEQALVDRVQELKESAVSAIREAQDKLGKHGVAVDFHAAAKEQTLVDRYQEAKDTAVATIMEAHDRSGKHAEAVNFQPRRELTQFCRQMDANGLLNYIMENQRDIAAIREEILAALKSAKEPARLVLDSLEGFYSINQTTNGKRRDSAALLMLRKACMMLMKSVAPLLVGADNPLNFETKQQAKAIADKWKTRLDVDAANRTSSLEAEAFLQLLATFGITSEFDEEELCELVLAVADRREAPNLCRSLGLTHKMPVVVEKLIHRRREIDAVHFVQAFKLTENFPPVRLLKAYLKDLRKNLQRKLRSATRAVGDQDDAHAQELAALKAVIRCVEAHKLQADYPLDPLQKRVVQLENSKANKKKRMGEVLMKHQQPKRAHANGGKHHRPVDLQLRPLPVYNQALVTEF